MINILIFSKDNSCQLEMLLRSVKTYFYEWKILRFTVLYSYSNKEYKKGYDKLIQYHPEFVYMEEVPGRFKRQVLDIIDPRHQASIFFRDNAVFKDYLFLKSEPIRELLKNDNIACVSLRLSPRIRFNFPEDAPISSPRMSSEHLWFWRNLSIPWGELGILNSDVLRTKDILPVLTDSEYHDLESFSKIDLKLFNKPYMACYDQSKIVSILPRHTDDHSLEQFREYLNESFLNLKRISLSITNGVSNKATYERLPYILEDAISYPVDKLSRIIEDNRICYKEILSNKDFVCSVHDGSYDITLLIPVKDRTYFFEPSISYLKKSISNGKYKVHVVYIENDYQPKFMDLCKSHDVDYIFVPLNVSKSNGFFAKSLCYNIGFLMCSKTPWYIFHDLDILVDTDYFAKLSCYLDKNPKWVQPYAKRRVRKVSKRVTDDICTGNFHKLSEIPELSTPPANAGSTGGSIVIRRDIFEKVGGYDPEIFYGYAPEDLFLWIKLESENKEIDYISSAFHEGAVYADDPGIEVYHLNHPHMENQNPYHGKMREILESFYAYRYADKLRILELKRNLLGM